MNGKISEIKWRIFISILTCIGFHFKFETLAQAISDELNSFSQISVDSAKYLLQTSYLTIEKYLKENSIYHPHKINNRLLNINNTVFITLYIDGKVRGCRGSKKGNIIESVIYATIKALKDRRFKPIEKEEIKKMFIELSILGPKEKINSPKEIELGIHGLYLVKGKKSAIYLPCVPIIYQMDRETLLARLCKKAGLKKNAWKNKETKIFKFETLDFLRTPKGEVVELTRGTLYVPLSEVNWIRIFRSAVYGCNWLVRNQNPNGSYMYLYYPHKDKESRQNSYVRQAGVSYAVALMYRFTKYKKYKTSSLQAIEYLLNNIKFLDKKKKLPYIYFAGTGKLGSTGLTLVAMSLLELHKESSEYAKIMKQFVYSILNMQNKDGSFMAYFEPKVLKPGQNYFPGEAMLGLIEYYKINPEERILRAIEKAFSYYKKYWKENKNRPFIPWHSCVWAQMYKITKKKKYADFVFEMNDWLITKQYDLKNSPYKDYFGGWVREGVPNFEAAVYVEGLAEAYSVAKMLKDKKRIDSYGKTIVRALRFVLNLQFKPVDMYYVKKPSKTLGGFRASLVKNYLRCDITDHAIVGMAKVLSYMEDLELLKYIRF